MPTGEPPVYDRIGSRYTATRRPDPRIAAAIGAALGDARTLVNVGAGAGAYEPARPPRRRRGALGRDDRPAPDRRRPVHPGGRRASALPRRGRRREPRRPHRPPLGGPGRGSQQSSAGSRAGASSSSRGTRTPATGSGSRPSTSRRSSSSTVRGSRWPRSNGPWARSRAIPVPIPHDCQDGFLGAFWRRPEAYLDPAVRAAISAFWLLDPERVRRGVARLADDLRSGRWQARHAALRERESLDLGYRLVVAE